MQEVLRLPLIWWYGKPRGVPGYLNMQQQW